MKSKGAKKSKPVKISATEHTNIEIGEGGVLYIRIVQPTDRPTTNTQMKKIQQGVLKSFKKEMPDTKVIVGFQDLHFSIITKKQEFIGRLDGQIKDPTSK